MSRDPLVERVVTALRSAPDAAERRTAERGWTVVGRVAPNPPRGARRAVRAWRPFLNAAVLVAAALAAALTPPGDAVADLLRRAIGEPAAAPPPRARPVAGAGLPGGGALLASGRNGPVVVRGATAIDRLLGAVGEAAWSPRERFVVATRGPEVIAVDRSGQRRWTVVASGRARFPRWSPDGFRVAYLAAGGLRVVAGDGTAERPLARARSVAPAWRPRTGRHVLASVDRYGRVIIHDVDTGRPVGRSRERGVVGLAWSGNGRRLYALRARDVVQLTPDGRSARFTAAARGVRNVAIAAAPQGRDFAVVAHRPDGRSELFADVTGRPRFLFGIPGPTRGLAWSPDGRWLAVAASRADAWLLLRPGPDGLRAQRTVEDVRRRLGRGAPVRLEGWCCTR